MAVGKGRRILETIAVRIESFNGCADVTTAKMTER